MSDRSSAGGSEFRTGTSMPREAKKTMVGARAAASAALQDPDRGAVTESGDALGLHMLSAGELGQLQLYTVLARTDLGIAACNAAGELTFLSPGLQKLLDQPFERHAEFEQVERYRLYESDGSTRMQPEAVPLARARNGEVVTDELLCARTATGNLLYLLCSALPVTCPEGSQVGAVLFAQDVTAEHAALKDQEQVHDRLVVTLNHEFRTPLTKLVGYVEILRDSSHDLPPDATRYLHKIRQAAEELTELVDSVTELADQHRSFRHRATSRDCTTPSRQQIDHRGDRQSRDVTG